MTSRIFHLVWLTALWLALWGDVSFANVTSGLLVAAIVTGISRVPRPGKVHFRPIAVARYVGYLVWQMIVSAGIVGWEIVTPRSGIRTGIVAVPLHGCSDALVTLIADSLSLPPGTFAIEVDHDPLVLYVHVLHLRDVDEVRRRVRRLEVLAVRAFGSADAIAAVEVDDTTLMDAT